MPTISLAIQKGGSGKTTTAINLAAALQQMGHSTLLIDLDPQANLSQALGISNEPEENIYTLIRQVSIGNDVDAEKCILQKNGQSVIPATLELANAELELVSVYGRENIVKNIIKPLKKSFEYVIIDCPPAVGMLTANALAASEYVLIPLQAEYLPLKGVESFMQTIKQIRKHLNPNLLVLGFLLTKYDEHKTMNRQILDKLTSEFGDLVFQSKIRINIALAKAQEIGQDIFSFDKSTHGARDYLQLAEEILAKISQ